MKRRLFFLIYSLLAGLFFVASAGPWLVKMWRRGGFGSGLLERFGIYKRDALFERGGAIYVHAVSVGEVLLARKLIEHWRSVSDEHFVLAATTSTGHAMAREAESEAVRVIYAPVDLRWITRAVLERFTPKAVVLMESEIWPNLLDLCDARGIPVAIANARLSARSAGRYAKLGGLVRPVLDLLGPVCVPEEEDLARWEAIGVRREKLTVTRNIKFDPGSARKPAKRGEFSALLAAFGEGRSIVLCASTFSGEEEALAQSIRTADGSFLPVIVPRHAERRGEVISALKKAGFTPALRSLNQTSGDVLVVDTTGELCDLTAHADIVVIGKSWRISAGGGQTPVEAILAGVPVIAGPDMTNFPALTDELVRVGGITQLEAVTELGDALRTLTDHEARKLQAASAARVLETHRGATAKTIEVISALL